MLNHNNGNKHDVTEIAFVVMLITAIILMFGLFFSSKAKTNNSSTIKEFTEQTFTSLADQPTEINVTEILTEVETTEEEADSMEFIEPTVPTIEKPKKEAPKEPEKESEKKTDEAKPTDSTSHSIKIKLTSSERDMLASLIYLEGRGESIEAQRAMGSVVLNRLESGKYGKTLRSVIYAKNQFSTARKISKKNVSQTQYEVVDYLIEHGSTLPSKVLYFRAGHYFSWATPYKKIDKTYFSY